MAIEVVVETGKGVSAVKRNICDQAAANSLGDDLSIQLQPGQLVSQYCCALGGFSIVEFVQFRSGIIVGRCSNGCRVNPNGFFTKFDRLGGHQRTLPFKTPQKA